MQLKAIETDVYLLFVGYIVVIAYIMITTGRYNCRDQKVYLIEKLFKPNKIAQNYYS